MKLELKPGVTIETNGADVVWTTKAGTETGKMVAVPQPISILAKSIQNQMTAQNASTTHFVRLNGGFVTLTGHQAETLTAFSIAHLNAIKAAHAAKRESVQAETFAAELATARKTGKPVQCSRKCIGEDATDQERGIGWETVYAQPNGKIITVRDWDY